MAIAANLTIPILRQDYSKAQDGSQKNGWMPGIISGALGSSAVDIGGYTTSETTYKATIPADFKDHKTVFIFNNTFAAAKTVTFKAGNSHQGVKDLTVSVPVGISVLWLESAPFVDNATGEIEIKTNATESDDYDLQMIGYEMR